MSVLKGGNSMQQAKKAKKLSSQQYNPQPVYVESDQDVLFILKVNMWEGMSKFIKFRIGNSPDELAYEFCKEHQLSPEIYDFICESLRQKLWQFNTGQLVETQSKGIQANVKESPKQNKIKPNKISQTLEVHESTMKTSPRDTRDERLMHQLSPQSTPDDKQNVKAKTMNKRSEFQATSWMVDEKLSGILRNISSSDRTQTVNDRGAIDNKVTRLAGEPAEETKRLDIRAEPRDSSPNYIKGILLLMTKMFMKGCSIMPSKSNTQPRCSIRSLH
jgi:hypothetical protein